MFRYDDKTIKRYEEKLAEFLNIEIRCEDFGKGYCKKEIACEICKVDSDEYYQKCREFTFGIGEGKSRKIKGLKRKGRNRKPEVFIPEFRVKEKLSPFQQGSKREKVFLFIRSRESTTLEDIMRFLAEEYGLRISTRHNAQNYINNIRKTLKKIGILELVSYKGHYFIDEKTRKKPIKKIEND